MSEPAERRYLTAEDLYELPDDGNHYELAAGLLVRMPPAGAWHSSVALRLGRFLDEYVEKQDLGRVAGADSGFILQRNPDIVRAPDAAFVAKARIPAGGPPRQFWPFAPDLVVEVVSPSDRSSELQVKIREYFTARTRIVWIVYPDSRTVRVHRSPDNFHILSENDRLDGEDVLPGFGCPVRRIFD